MCSTLTNDSGDDDNININLNQISNFKSLNIKKNNNNSNLSIKIGSIDSLRDLDDDDKLNKLSPNDAKLIFKKLQKVIPKVESKTLNKLKTKAINLTEFVDLKSLSAKSYEPNDNDEIIKMRKSIKDKSDFVKFINSNYNDPKTKTLNSLLKFFASQIQSKKIQDFSLLTYKIVNESDPLANRSLSLPAALLLSPKDGKNYELFQKAIDLGIVKPNEKFSYEDEDGQYLTKTPYEFIIDKCLNVKNNSLEFNDDYIKSYKKLITNNKIKLSPIERSGTALSILRIENNIKEKYNLKKDIHNILEKYSNEDFLFSDEITNHDDVKITIDDIDKNLSQKTKYKNLRNTLKSIVTNNNGSFAYNRLFGEIYNSPDELFKDDSFKIKLIKYLLKQKCLNPKLIFNSDFGNSTKNDFVRELVSIVAYDGFTGKRKPRITTEKDINELKEIFTILMTTKYLRPKLKEIFKNFFNGFIREGMIYSKIDFRALKDIENTFYDNIVSNVNS